MASGLLARTEEWRGALARRTSAGALWPRLSAWIETSLIVLGLLAQFFLLPHILDADGLTRYQMLDALLRNGALMESKYSLIGPLFAAPLWLLGAFFGDTAWWVARFNTRFPGRGPAHALSAAAEPHGPAVAARIPVAAARGLDVPGACRGVLWRGLHRVLRRRGVILLFTRARWGGWVALIVGVANTPATIVGLVLMMAQRLLRSRRLRYALIPVGALALTGLESWIRRGNPFANPYPDDHGYTTFMPYSGLPGFSYPFYLGLLSLIFSFGKGIIFFAPGLLLPARRALGAPVGAAADDSPALAALRGRADPGLCLVVGMVWWLVLGATLPALRLDSSLAGAGGLAAQGGRFALDAARRAGGPDAFVLGGAEWRGLQRRDARAGLPLERLRT